jgi:hypothetical protein
MPPARLRLLPAVLAYSTRYPSRTSSRNPKADGWRVVTQYRQAQASARCSGVTDTHHDCHHSPAVAALRLPARPRSTRRSRSTLFGWILAIACALRGHLATAARAVRHARPRRLLPAQLFAELLIAWVAATYHHISAAVCLRRWTHHDHSQT